MRPEGRKAMGYYPTPEHLVPMIQSYVAFPEGPAAVLDPFAGEGIALSLFATGTSVTTYGVELDLRRAKEAAARLDQVVQGDLEGCRISASSVSCLYFNPPYDWAATADPDERAERTEVQYLRRCLRYLVTGGLLVALVPQTRLDVMARTLATHFDNVTVNRFPEKDYQAYKQVVIFGQKRPLPQRNAASESYFSAISDPKSGQIPSLEPQTHPTYTIPSTPAQIQIFLGPSLRSQEADILENSSSLWSALKDWIPLPTPLQGNPPLPLHTGHQAQVMAAGGFNGAMGTGAERHLVKGTVMKKKESVNEEEEDAEGNPVHVTRETETFGIHIHLLTCDGTLLKLV